MIGLFLLDGSNASIGLSFSSIFIGSHCQAPAGLFFNSQSYFIKRWKYPWSHWVGLVVQAPSKPLVTASFPTPDLVGFFHPNPCSSISPASGSLPNFEASPLPCAFPTVWPPAVKATVSSSFIAIRLKVVLTSIAVLKGSGLPSTPSGFT